MLIVMEEKAVNDATGYCFVSQRCRCIRRRKNLQYRSRAAISVQTEYHFFSSHGEATPKPGIENFKAV